VGRVTAEESAMARSSNPAPPSHEGSGQQRTTKIRRTHHRQVFGLAGIATVAGCVPMQRRFPGRRLRPSALWRSSFPLTAAGQSRIHTGFPFNPAGLLPRQAPIAPRL
jgi:hypothetical protein